MKGCRRRRIPRPHHGGSTQGNPEDYREADFDPANFSEDDIEELGAYFERETRTQLANRGIKIIDWYPIELLRLNGAMCLHMSYSRAGEDGETVRVNTYAFPHNDRLVRVTISYRASDASMWSEDLELALPTLEFAWALQALITLSESVRGNHGRNTRMVTFRASYATILRNRIKRL